MSLLKPRKKLAPKPGRTVDNFFGHRLQFRAWLDQAVCLYCGEVFSGIMLHIAHAAADESSSPVKRCRVAAREGL